MEYIENKIKHEYLQYCSLYKCLVLSGQLVYNYLRDNVLVPFSNVIAPCESIDTSPLTITL